MNLAWLKKLILRLFPGIEDYSKIHVARITRVYTFTGPEVQKAPFAVVDLELLGVDFKKDKRFKRPLKAIRLTTPNHYIQAPPKKGGLVTLAFAFWSPTQAMVLNHIHSDVDITPGVFKVTGADIAKFTAKQFVFLGSGEDQAVLGSKLNDQLTALCDAIDLLGSVSVFGTPQPKYAEVKIKLDLVKLQLPTILSTQVKVGDNAS